MASKETDTQQDKNSCAPKTKGRSAPMDIHVGMRLRMRRALLGMTQEGLAEKLGLTFQQIQKYERGANRISASRLHQLSQILNVPVDYFFANFEEESGKESKSLSPGQTVRGMSDNAQDPILSSDVMERKETLDLVRLYYSVRDEEERKNLLKILKSMAENMSSSVTA